jgi:hypothetical protein
VVSRMFFEKSEKSPWIFSCDIFNLINSFISGCSSATTHQANQKMPNRLTQRRTSSFVESTFSPDAVRLRADFLNSIPLIPLIPLKPKITKISTPPTVRGRQYQFFLILYPYHGPKSDILSCIYHFKKSDIW